MNCRLFFLLVFRKVSSMLYPKLITDDGLQGSGEKHRRSKEGNKQFSGSTVGDKLVPIYVYRQSF
jgi:hypothetical protein